MTPKEKTEPQSGSSASPGSVGALELRRECGICRCHVTVEDWAECKWPTCRAFFGSLPLVTPNTQVAHGERKS